VNRQLTQFGAIQNPLGIRTIGEMPNLTAAMERAEWPGSKIEKVMGRNWLRVFKEVWSA
jgi:membrane dipeptidase